MEMTTTESRALHELLVVLTKDIEECRCTSIVQNLIWFYICCINGEELSDTFYLDGFQLPSVAPSHPALTMVNNGQGEFECAICHRHYAARKLWPTTVTDSSCFNVLIERYRIIVYEAHKTVP